MSRTWGGILKWHDGTEWKEIVEGNFKIFTDEWKVVDSSHFKMYYPESGDTSAGWYPIRMAASTLLQGLIGYWKMNDPSGLIYDALKHTDATPYNGPIFEQTGKIGNGINFGTTTNTGARLTDSSVLAYLNPEGDVYSISSWVKLDTLPSVTGHTYAIVRSSLASSPWENITFRVGTDDKPSLRFTGLSDNNYTTHPTTLNTDTWYHLVAVINGAGNKPLIYLNDVSVQGGTTQGGDIYDVSGSTAGYSIGNAYSSGGLCFDGIIDELAIWRKALTPFEVTQLYNSGNGYEIPLDTPEVPEAETTSLLARMDEQPSAGLATLINTTIKDLKDTGIWAKLDTIGFYAVHTQQAALLDWKGYKNHYYNGAIRFQPGIGFDNSLNAASVYVGIAYIANTDGSALTLDNALMGCWLEENGDTTASRSLMGSRLSGQYNTMLTRSNGTFYGNINTGDTASSNLGTFSYGLVCVDRDSSSYQTGYINGVKGTPQAKASVRKTERYPWMSYAQSYTAYGYNSHLYKNGFMGGSLTESEHEAFYNILNNFNSNVASYV